MIYDEYQEKMEELDQPDFFNLKIKFLNDHNFHKSTGTFEEINALKNKIEGLARQEWQRQIDEIMKVENYIVQEFSAGCYEQYAKEFVSRDISDYVFEFAYNEILTRYEVEECVSDYFKNIEEEYEKLLNFVSRIREGYIV